MSWLTPEQHRTLTAALERLVPGAGAAGGAGYVDQLLSAFDHDPPRIWAGGPFSGRAGGEAGFDRWLELGTVEELAWRIRIEGSRGLPEREFNGPHRGWQEVYRDGLAALGADFAGVDPEEQDRRLKAQPELRAVAFDHGCESLYGDPVYGGNRDSAGWRSIGFDGDVQPRGWTDDEVQAPA